MTAADDELHPPPDDDPFWTETLWLGFAVPDRDLTGVIYSIMRPNQHIASLGVYLWDDTGRLEPDALYFHAMGHLPMPASLRSMDLPGFAHRCVEPLRAYEVAYDDGVELAVQLRYDALHPPIGRGFGEVAAGYSQPCRVTGTVRLNGETVAVDCCELRASAWTHRSDDRPTPLAPDLDPIPGYSDTYGFSDDVSFFVGTAGTQTLTHSHGGYLLRDGDLQPLTEAERTVVRRSPDGYPKELVVEATDATGRTIHARGSCVNHLRLAMPGYTFSVNGTRWDLDGRALWGQDHDVAGGRPARHPKRPQKI
jgi:hypothetical protein